MKKAFALFLSLALLLGCAAPAALAEEEKGMTLEEMGMTLRPGDLFGGLRGYAEIARDGILKESGPFAAAMELLYYPVPREKVEGVEILSEDVLEDASSLGTSALIVLVTDGTPEEVLSAAGLNWLFAPADLKEFDKKDAFTWYSLSVPCEGLLEAYDEKTAQDPERYPASLRDAWQKDLQALQTDAVETLRGLEKQTPADPVKKAVGSVLSFETVDLDGNRVTSEDLFAKNDFTMVNLWGTWCPACVGEMEELARLHLEFQEKGCGIVGIQWEQQPVAAVADEARRILSDHQVTYPNALYPAGCAALDVLATVFPTSFFVDREGRILTAPIQGAYPDRYRADLESLLQGQQAQQDADASAAAGPYRITVVDEAGAPVPGVMIQFCSDATCTLGQTDESGAAVFDFPPDAYTLHLLKVPEGYAPDPTEYRIGPNTPEMTVVVKKAQ